MRAIDIRKNASLDTLADALETQAKRYEHQYQLLANGPGMMDWKTRVRMEDAWSAYRDLKQAAEHVRRHADGGHR